MINCHLRLELEKDLITPYFVKYFDSLGEIVEKKDTKETLLEKIEKEKNGENRPDVIKNFQNKIAKLEEEDDV